MMLRRVRSLSLLVLSSIVAACASLPASLPPLPAVNSELPLVRAWTYFDSVESERRAALLPLGVHGQSAYWFDGAGVLRTFAAANGARGWTFSTNGLASSAVGFGDDGSVYFGTRDGKVVALDSTTGKEKWRATVSTEVLSPPQGASGIVVVQCGDGKLFGLSAEDGHQVWNLDNTIPLLTLRGTSAPLIRGDQVYFGLANGKVLAVKLYDGTIRWQVELAVSRGRSELERMVDVDGAMRVSGDSVYAVAFHGRLVSVAQNTGRVVWSRDISSSLGLDVDDTAVYLTDDEDNVLAISQTTGGVLWKQAGLAGRHLSAPVVYGDYIVVTDAEGYLHWLSRGEGQFKHRQRIDDVSLAGEPVIANGNVYIASRGGVVDAWRLPAPP